MTRSWGGRTIGILLFVVTGLVICDEWGLATWALDAKPAVTLALIAVYLPQVRASRKAFIIFAALLTVFLAATNPAWRTTVLAALDTTAFIAAFFTALTILKSAAQTSPAIRRAGRFLAGQPPGRRYLALTAGGQAFTLLLNYGSLQLLGAMAVSSAAEEQNPEIRAIRMRRMLLAIERGLISTLPWSPLSFAVAISTATVPGTSWAGILLPSMVTGLIAAGTGWALDTIFKPKVSSSRPTRSAPPEGSWATMAPLALLLAILVVSVGTLHELTSVRIVGLVTVIVPAMATGWMLLQHRHDRPLQSVGRRYKTYFFEELPAFSGEMTLIMMAGYIGTVGAAVLAPVLNDLGLDLSLLPTWVLLVGFVWIIPVLGQLAMNPILAVTLIGPFIPSAETLGVSPTAVVVALTAGWAISGASSPFTATQLLLAHHAGVSAWSVGLRWNGLFTLTCLVLLSAWVLVYAYVF
ncbi:hypothetical protein EF888_15845 [Silicimonas algicola]|uniref:H+/citrate symporter n=1 Tax=Silicimonas algicola TaxID=1826607 RepID=A0A316G5E7_9RHOB|nr:hypothetical protein [Silicimonas algicola]AZQ68474.1 hypothetical protein EF888_15845 [Silicimonas algicola]PWK55822.1 hypothetical protein C8D95_106218 [Silicimonas algicola]